MKKYMQGKTIKSLDVLYKQEFIYIHDRLWHVGWFQNLYFGWLAYKCKNGHVRKAIKIRRDEIERKHRNDNT